jgi:tyrosine-protein phosphatase YwqE
MVVTPHMTCLREADGFLRMRDRKLRQLRRELERLEIGVVLFPGAEVFIDDSIFYENGLERLTINTAAICWWNFPARDCGRTA